MNHHIWSNSGQSLPAKKLAFSTLRPKSLTHPGCELPSPVRWRRVPPGHPTVPFRLYLSDSESWSPIRRRQEPPGQTTLPFPPHGRRDLPIQTASIFLPSDVGESLPATQLTFLSLPVRHSESWSPVGRRQEPPGQTTLPFKPVARRGLPVRHSDSETTVGRRREPPGQTTSLFQASCSTRLTRPTLRFWNHRRTSATSLSSLLAPSSSHSSALIPTSSALPKRPWDSALSERPRDSALPERPQEPAPFQELTESTPEPAPFQELTKSTPEPAPFQELTKSTPEPAPFQEITESTPEPAPVQELTGSTPEPAPVQELTESTPEPAPVQELTSPLQSPLRSRSSPSPLQSPLRSRSSPSPLQSPLRSRSLQRPLQNAPQRLWNSPRKLRRGYPPWLPESPDPPSPLIHHGRPSIPAPLLVPERDPNQSKQARPAPYNIQHTTMGRGGALEASRHMEIGQVASRAVPVRGPIVDQWGNVRPVSPFLLCPYMVLPVLVLCPCVLIMFQVCLVSSLFCPMFPVGYYVKYIRQTVNIICVCLTPSVQ